MVSLIESGLSRRGNCGDAKNASRTDLVLRSFWHRPDEPALECTRRRSVLLRRCGDEGPCRLVDGSLVWGEHDEGQACRVGNLTALVREKDPIDDTFPFGEHLLYLGADP